MTAGNCRKRIVGRANKLVVETGSRTCEQKKQQSMILESLCQPGGLGATNQTLTKVEGHYQIGLLWSDRDVQLPDNRSVAEIRLKHLQRRLEQDPDLKCRYAAIIVD